MSNEASGVGLADAIATVRAELERHTQRLDRPLVGASRALELREVVDERAVDDASASAAL